MGTLIHTHTHFHSLKLVFLQHILYVFSFQVKKISANNSHENTNLNSPHKISLCGKLISKYVCLPTLRYTLFDTWTSLSLYRRITADNEIMYLKQEYRKRGSLQPAQPSPAQPATIHPPLPGIYTYYICTYCSAVKNLGEKNSKTVKNVDY